ncbi:MAG: hypothetical protein ACKV19_14925 [Verrucomicrobiales bacterium]
MTRRPVFSRLRLALAALLLSCTLGLPSALAYVDDAHSMAMELATPYVEKGFQVRQDYWSGEVKTGTAKQVKAQLFKGNEYWFFLGCDADQCELELKIVDAKGKTLHVETKKIKGAIGVRILPPKTGSYAVIFTVTSTDVEKPSWALAYAYR